MLRVNDYTGTRELAGKVVASKSPNTIGGSEYRIM